MHGETIKSIILLFITILCVAASHCVYKRISVDVCAFVVTVIVYIRIMHGLWIM